MEERRTELEKALTENDCKLRNDSKMCQAYIKRGKFINPKYNTVDKIARHMKRIQNVYDLSNDIYKTKLIPLLEKYKSYFHKYDLYNYVELIIFQMLEIECGLKLLWDNELNQTFITSTK